MGLQLIISNDEIIISQFYHLSYTMYAETLHVTLKRFLLLSKVIKSISAVKPRCFPHNNISPVTRGIPQLTSKSKVHYRVHKNPNLSLCLI